MRINTNVDAMRAYSNYATWNAAKSKSLLRISSGKRINSFADDPAGACIAVKMGVQVSGLKVAKRNAQDGISLIQTAEGALNETHSILGRMRDLAVQAANGTLTYEDRAAIDKEFQALRQEIAAQQNAAAHDAEERHGQEAAGRVEFGADAAAADEESGHEEHDDARCRRQQRP